MATVAQNPGAIVYAVSEASSQPSGESATQTLSSLREPTASHFDATDVSRHAFSSTSLEEKLSYPDTSGLYPRDANTYFSRQNCEICPSCIVQPTHANDVAETIKVVTTLRNENHDVRFAIRSGGHTHWAAANNVEAGVTIDLRKSNFVRIHTDRKRVTIGPGARWGAVYAVVEEEGLAVSGGRVSSVGVGGLTLGGGISFFSPRKGFVCDNVISFESVTAAGEVLSVTQGTHPDLWLALKGGSNNFGVVTAFEVRCFDQGPVWVGTHIYPLSETNEVTTTFDKIANAGKDYDESVSVILTAAFQADAGSFWMGALRHTRGDASAPSSAALKAIETSYREDRVTTISDAMIAYGENLNGEKSHIWFTTTTQSDPQVLEAGFELWKKTRDKSDKYQT